jgi:hypothetical protein
MAGVSMLDGQGAPGFQPGGVGRPLQSQQMNPRIYSNPNPIPGLLSPF